MDQYTYFIAFLAQGARERGLGAEAVLVFLDYLFAYFPFRKVYAEVYDFNRGSLGPLRSGGFHEEGRLTRHTWFGDRHWDLHVLGLFRDEWLVVRRRFDRVLKPLRAGAIDDLNRKGNYAALRS